MRFWSACLGVIFLVGCQPADVKVKSVRERLEAGEIIEFSEPGYRYKGCKEDNADWDDLRIGPDSTSETVLGERDRIVIGQQQSRLNPGLYSCFRVGSTIDLSPYKFKGQGSPGRVQITKLAWVHIDHLKKSQMKGRYFASNEGFYAAKDEMRFVLKNAPDKFGVVTLVEVRYVGGTAFDEKSINEKASGLDESDGFQATRKDGDSLNRNCTHKDGTPKEKALKVTDLMAYAIRGGELLSAYKLGYTPCFIQGQQIDLKVDYRSDEIIKTVKISKVKRVRRKFLKAEHFELPNLSYAALKSEIDQEAKENPEEFISIIDFVEQEDKGVPIQFVNRALAHDHSDIWDQLLDSETYDLNQEWLTDLEKFNRQEPRTPVTQTSPAKEL